MNPTAAETQFRSALALHRSGRLPEAEAQYREALKSNPRHFDAMHLLGVLHAQCGDAAGAVALIEEALKIDPTSVAAYINRGNALKELGRFAEALVGYDAAIARDPHSASAFNNRGAVLKELDRLTDALASYDKALALKSDYAEAHNNRAIVLQKLGRLQEALAACDRAIALMPGLADIHHNRGSVLEALQRNDEAFAGYQRAIELNPNYADAYNNRGAISLGRKRFDEALADFDRAIAINSSFAQAFANRGTALQELGRLDEALVNFDRAIEIKPDFAAALVARGSTLQTMKRLEQALASFDRAAMIEPANMQAISGSFMVAAHLCDWRNRDQKQREIVRFALAGEGIVPFVMIAATGLAEPQRKAAEIYSRIHFPERNPVRPRGYDHERVRIGYLSPDFRNHPVGGLVAELFELHDRSRFETHAFSLSPSDGSTLRRRLERSFDHFHDVRMASDADIVAAIAASEIDIVVDLTGYTQGGRPGIMAYRPAPVSVSYLGFPGTMGTKYYDYLFADPYLIPQQSRAFYTENVVYLPDCYQANDTKRTIAEPAPARAEAGLPETGFVFCCFNNGFKITPEIFAVWMRLLDKVDGSVLWLNAIGEEAQNNLRKEMRARGVDADRLKIAKFMPAVEDHLSRLRLADLFLDTLPYNAHTTASDALWSGVPLITCSHDAFASRVAGSLLTAIGMPELITGNLADYEALALKLARDSQLLARIREKLARNRLTEPLFDSIRFCKHVESAYVTMLERLRTGLPPQSFAVAPID